MCGRFNRLVGGHNRSSLSHFVPLSRLFACRRCSERKAKNTTWHRKITTANEVSKETRENDESLACAIRMDLLPFLFPYTGNQSFSRLATSPLHFFFFVVVDVDAFVFNFTATFQFIFVALHGSLSLSPFLYSVTDLSSKRKESDKRKSENNPPIIKTKETFGLGFELVLFRVLIARAILFSDANFRYRERSFDH